MAYPAPTQTSSLFSQRADDSSDLLGDLPTVDNVATHTRTATHGLSYNGTLPHATGNELALSTASSSSSGGKRRAIEIYGSSPKSNGEALPVVYPHNTIEIHRAIQPRAAVIQAQEQNTINKLLVSELDRVKADQRRMNEEILALRLENLKLTSILRDRLEPPNDQAERTSQALLSSPKLQQTASSSSIPLKDRPLIVFDLTKEEPTALAANKQFCSLLGYSQAEVVGQPWTRFVPGEYIARTLKLMTSQPPITVFDQVYRHKNGTHFVAQDNHTILRDQHNGRMVADSVYITPCTLDLSDIHFATTNVSMVPRLMGPSYTPEVISSSSSSSSSQPTMQSATFQYPGASLPSTNDSVLGSMSSSSSSSPRSVVWEPEPTVSRRARPPSGAPTAFTAATKPVHSPPNESPFFDWGQHTPHGPPPALPAAQMPDSLSDSSGLGQMEDLMEASPNAPYSTYLSGLSPLPTDEAFVNSLLTDSIDLDGLNTDDANADDNDPLQFPLESMLTGVQGEESFARHGAALSTSGLDDEPMQF